MDAFIFIRNAYVGVHTKAFKRLKSSASPQLSIGSYIITENQKKMDWNIEKKISVVLIWFLFNIKNKLDGYIFICIFCLFHHKDFKLYLSAMY